MLSRAAVSPSMCFTFEGAYLEELILLLGSRCVLVKQLPGIIGWFTHRAARRRP
jgi:hypothetical protein